MKALSERRSIYYQTTTEPKVIPKASTWQEMNHLGKCQELLCHQPQRQGQFLLQTGRKTPNDTKRTTSLIGHEPADHTEGLQNLFLSLKNEWRCFSTCCCVGEASYFLPHHRFGERTRNAPPRVNYLGRHLSKLFPLISEEQ